MNKRVILILALLFVVVSASAQDTRIAFLLPAPMGGESDVLHLTKEDIASDRLSIALKRGYRPNTTDIVDTLLAPFGYGWNFGAESGDTMAAYFDPPAGCMIKSIGIFTQNWAGQFCDGFDLLIYKSGVDPSSFPLDSTNSNGWIGDWNIGGVWRGCSWAGPPLAELLWGAYPVTAIDGQWIWTQMQWGGNEPNSDGEPFMVVYAPHGAQGQNIGTLAGNASNYPTWRGFKYSHDFGPSNKSGWHWYWYGWILLVEVEYYENTPPVITYTPASTTVYTGDRTLTCQITDIDAAIPAQAGVEQAKLYYNVNGSGFVGTDMTLIAGSNTNGTWSGVIPGPLVPDDNVQYYFYAADFGGMDTTSQVSSYRIFEKKRDILVFLNDDLTGKAIVPLYFYGIDYRYDLWYGPSDGPVTSDLVAMYNYIVQLDQGAPYTDVALTDSVIGEWLTGPWKSNTNKGYLLSSQEWAYYYTGRVEADFDPGDWHYDVLGVDELIDDISPINAESHPLSPVASDMIAGDMAIWFSAPAHDTLQLAHDIYHVFGELNKNDGIHTHNPLSIPCIISSETNDAMGIYTENAGVKTAFFSYDLLSMTAGGRYGDPHYHLVMADTLNPGDPVSGGNLIGKVLDWFGAPTSVEGEVTAPLRYELRQNHPNPFNPVTTLQFCLAAPGHVKISIFNMLGQRVAILVDEVIAAGMHSATWDGSEMSTGLYFCRLSAGDIAITRKMMLVR